MCRISDYLFFHISKKKPCLLDLEKTLIHPCKEKRIRKYPAGGWCNRCGHGRFWVGEVTGWVRWLWCVPKVAIFWWGKNSRRILIWPTLENGWNWLVPFHNVWQKNPQKWSFLLPFFTGYDFCWDFSKRHFQDHPFRVLCILSDIGILGFQQKSWYKFVISLPGPVPNSS